MSKVLIVGFNGPPQSWKSTVARDTGMMLMSRDIGVAQLSFVQFWDKALPALMYELDQAFNFDADKASHQRIRAGKALSYEESKKLRIGGYLGRDFQIAATEAWKAMIPNLPARYMAARIEAIANSGFTTMPIVILLENVGFPEEYEILADLEYQMLKVYMTEKRPEYHQYAYERGERFIDDSRVCLRAADSVIDPTAAKLTALIQAKLGL